MLLAPRPQTARGYACVRPQTPKPFPTCNICLATTNPHKLEEVRDVFNASVSHQPDAVTWTTLADLPAELPEPEEDQDTFEGNALLKAFFYARATGQICLADDSGIEVDALGGRPGVKSARYSGVSGPRSVVDPANNAKLLEELAALDAVRRRPRGPLRLRHEPGDPRRTA